MFPKPFWGFVVIIVVVPVRNIHCQACKFLKCLSQNLNWVSFNFVTEYFIVFEV